MSITFGPGTYFIELNENDKPILLTHSGIPLEDPEFRAVAGQESSFTFEIKAQDNERLFTFAELPITWTGRDGQPMKQPPSIYIVAVTITVNPPSPLRFEKRFPFDLRFDVGESSEGLWSADGTKPLDPTIVENPPS
jgi:hypothetical protein